jgi:hypothetical protein
MPNVEISTILSLNKLLVLQVTTFLNSEVDNKKIGKPVI